MIFTLRAERQGARMSKIENDGGLNPVWYRMLYSCTHMATVGVKGLILSEEATTSSPVTITVLCRPMFVFVCYWLFVCGGCYSDAEAVSSSHHVVLSDC